VGEHPHLPSVANNNDAMLRSRLCRAHDIIAAASRHVTLSDDAVAGGRQRMRRYGTVAPYRLARHGLFLLTAAANDSIDTVTPTPAPYIQRARLCAP